ncbi:PIG-L deacetylase family protein [Chloroflexota bacterium]
MNAKMVDYDNDYIPRSALVVFAHPDDAEFLVGGTVAKWTATKCIVNYLVCTNGNVGIHNKRVPLEELALIRVTEQRRACDILGVKDVFFLGLNDCELEPDLLLRREIVRIIRQYKPEIVICDDPETIIFSDDFLPGEENINHPDHRASGLATIDAVFPCASMPLLWPELGPPHNVKALYLRGDVQHNVWIDISATIEVKIKALLQHKSQLWEWDPRETILSWATWEGRNKGMKFAEAFRVIKV